MIKYIVIININLLNLRGVSTNKTIICFIAMQTYKELNIKCVTIIFKLFYIFTQLYNLCTIQLILPLHK